LVPQTLGALGAFLTLVAPGIVFELLRERRRVRRTESAFREASRVALGSLVFSLLASVVLIGVHALFRSLFAANVLIDLDRFAANGASYARQHVGSIAFSVLAELALACAFAVLVDFLLARRGHETRSVQPETAWRVVFRTDRPKDSVPWVHVHLEDGSSFFGFLRTHTASGDPDDREIVLEGAELTYLGKPLGGEDAVEETVIGGRWDRVVIPASRVKYLRVQYRDVTTGRRVIPRRPRPAVNKVTAQPKSPS
jgi:hypothetical protein